MEAGQGNAAGEEETLLAREAGIEDVALSARHPSIRSSQAARVR
jgi:hypothetical protein